MVLVKMRGFPSAGPLILSAFFFFFASLFTSIAFRVRPERWRVPGVLIDV